MSCDFKLEFTSGSMSGYYIITVDSPAGAASGQLRLDTEWLLARRQELGSAVLATAVAGRGGPSAQELPIREVGQQLFAAVFAERVYGRYTVSVQEAARRGEPLRVVLRLRAPELTGLPWEAMFDPEADEYLCQRQPIVRYVETAQPANPLPVKPPLRILGLVSAPSNLPALDVAEERRRLTHAVEDLVKRRQVELTWVSGGTWPHLQEMRPDGHWHVLHFIGHGGIDRGTEVLALEDEVTGQANLVSSARFARLLQTCRPVPRLVVLNSCQSGESAIDDLLSSTAAALVRSGISASVAMQFAVTDPAALAFSRGFYQALAHDQPVDEAVRLGRIAIDGTSENTLEWVAPVLYLRTDETRLFSTIRPDGGTVPARQTQPSPMQAELESTLQGLYMQALAAMRTGRHADALTLFDSLLTLEPDYRDAADRRDAARSSHQSAASYERGRAAEAVGNWAAAVAEYAAITEPDYRDVSQRLADNTRRQQIASLQEELRMHVQASEWRAVIAVCDEMTALGERSAEADRASKTARQQIRREEAASRAEFERPEQQDLPAPAADARRGRRDRLAESDDARSRQHSSKLVGRKRRSFYPWHLTVKRRKETGSAELAASSNAAQTPPSSAIPPIPVLNEDIQVARDGDRVQCSIFAPRMVTAGSAFLVQAFAHIPSQTSRVIDTAMEFDPGSVRRAYKTLEPIVLRDTKLVFRLTMPGLQIDDPVQSMIWLGRPESVQFGVSIPSRYRFGNVVGTITVSQDWMPIGHIKFVLMVTAGPMVGHERPPEQISAVGEAAMFYKKAFISYASENRARVLEAVQVLPTVGVETFQDILDLEPGERWERSLYQHIDNSDIVLLFWSTAAKRSKWVRKEIQYALSRKHGDEFASPEIGPVIIEGPPVPRPWKELGYLHFNDRMIYYLNQ
jgi:hypothetical protein